MKKYSPLIIFTVAIAITTPLFYTFSTPIAPGGKDSRGTLAILFSGMKNFSTCSGQFIVTGFDSISKIPQCKTRDNFLKDYFKTQSAIVPTGNIVTGFDPSGTMVSNSAQNMIKQVISGIPGPVSTMQGLRGFTVTNPVYSRDIGYWEDNGGAGIKYDGDVSVGGFIGGEISTTEVKSPATASAGNHLLNKAQFMGDMQSLCTAPGGLNGIWDGSTCIPQKCTINVPAAYSPMNHATWKIAYKDISVPYGQTCKTENRFCRNGSLSGSYMQTDCYYWETGSFPANNGSCGPQSVNRTVQCKSSVTGGVVSDSLCDSSKPTDTKVYNNPACPIDCQGYWSGYGSCSVSCGPGIKTRTFTQTTPAQYGGASCTSKYGVEDGDTGSASCNEGACTPTSGLWHWDGSSEVGNDGNCGFKNTACSPIGAMKVCCGSQGVPSGFGGCKHFSGNPFIVVDPLSYRCE